MLVGRAGGDGGGIVEGRGGRGSSKLLYNNSFFFLNYCAFLPYVFFYMIRA